MHVASPPSLAGRAKPCLLRMRIALAPVLGAVSGIAPHVLVGTDAIARAIESTGHRAGRGRRGGDGALLPAFIDTTCPHAHASALAGEPVRVRRMATGVERHFGRSEGVSA